MKQGSKYLNIISFISKKNEKHTVNKTSVFKHKANGVFADTDFFKSVGFKTCVLELFDIKSSL